MFKFVVDNEEYTARFKYSWELERVIKTYREFNAPDVTVLERNKKIYVGTRCQLFDKDCKMVAEGYSLCSHKDQFNKKTGKKLALRRALENAQFTREQRYEIWKTVRDILGE